MMFIVRLFGAGLLLAGLGVASAQTEQYADPPGRVARLADFTGQVWLYNADSGEWVGAVRNHPVTAGDRLATEPGARAEVQLGSTTVRLDSSTELGIAVLDDEHLSLQMISGSATARVVDLVGADRFDLSTDEGNFVVQEPGAYRFDRDGSASRVTVYSGVVRYEGPYSALPVPAGQRAEFWIDSGGVAQYSVSAPADDAFAAWNSDRDRVALAGVSARYVSPEMTGAEDLDRYGRWEQSPEYGALWIPSAVAVDWAPYRSGHWAWVRPWGWTWIDDAPWGFAPFHYGRWVYVRNNWCWTPGARVARPVYAPALVAWVGGPRASVPITIGGGPAVGWFPLAPREVYVPSYRVSPRYAQNINVTQVTNVAVINNVFNNPQGHRDFDNRRLPNAITIVPAGVLTSRQPVAPAAAQVRQNPSWAREIANQPGGRAVTLIAPPVAAPPVRGVDSRAVRAPPGFAERPVDGRSALPERDRDGRSGQQGRPESPRPTPPVLQPPAAPNPAVNPGAPRAVTQPMPPSDNAVRRDDPRRSIDRSDATLHAPAPSPTPAPAVARPPAAATIQTAPMMRPLPVQRGEERRAPARPTEAAPVASEPHPQPRVERAAPAIVPTPTPTPTARPVESPKPVEARRPAPASAPVAKRTEPRPLVESPGADARRGDPRDQQR
jgi:hypothetical protein